MKNSNRSVFTRVVGVVKQINVGCLRAEEVLFVPSQEVSRLEGAVFRLTLRFLEVTCDVAAVCKISAFRVKPWGWNRLYIWTIVHGFSTLNQLKKILYTIDNIDAFRFAYLELNLFADLFFLLTSFRILVTAPVPINMKYVPQPSGQGRHGYLPTLDPLLSFW